MPPLAGGPAGKSTGPVALLLPLSGQMAPIGQVLQNAAKLAYTGNSGPPLDIRDTGGTPAGAAAAAQAALAAGDGLILGPLTSGEARAVQPLAQAAGVNDLAFTNDGTLAAPGFWPMGITPTQQVHRIVQAAQQAGRTQVAALLPDTQFGHSLGDALQSETVALGEPAPQITFYEPDFGSLTQAVRDMSGFAGRGGAVDDQIKAAQALNTDAGRATVQQLQHQQIPPPSFNALFLGATSVDSLAEVASLLPYYSVNQPQVQLLGPSLWGSIAGEMASNAVLNGALFAAPDPQAAAAFNAKYQAVYGNMPPAIAEIAFDAAAIARLAASGAGYTNAVLADPSGFTGTNGPLLLLPNGQVLRGLAVLRVQPGGAVVAAPAPAQLNTPTS